MPPAVEVIVAGVRFKYPTCYVLVTDLDGTSAFEATSNIAKAMHASRDPGNQIWTQSYKRQLQHRLRYAEISPNQRSQKCHMTIFQSK